MEVQLRFAGYDEGATPNAEQTVVHIELFDVPQFTDGWDGPTKYQIHAFSQSTWDAMGNGEIGVQPDLKSVWLQGPADFVWDNVIFPADPENDPSTWYFLVWQVDVNGNEIGYWEDPEVITGELLGNQPTGRSWTKPLARTWT